MSIRKTNTQRPAILSSPEYARQKEIYADGMRKLSRCHICPCERQNGRSTYVRVLMAFITLLCVMAVLFLFCVNLLRSSKRRVEAEYQARQVTEQARNNLAKRVAEATADLTQSQKELTAQREQLKVSEERSRLILESSAEGIFGTDIEGRITFVNPAACRMLGFHRRGTDRATFSRRLSSSPARRQRVSEGRMSDVRRLQARQGQPH